MLELPEEPEYFPANIIETLVAACQLIDEDSAPGANDGIRIHRRPLRIADQTQTLGIFPTHWQPNENTMEIGRGAPGEFTFNTHMILVQSLIKDLDEERGVAANAYFSTLVRNTLYRSAVLKTIMPQLSAEVMGVRERVHRWGITRHHLQSDLIKGGYIFLSTIEFWVWTQID